VSLCKLPEVPRLWNTTIEAHRAAVRDATLDAVGALVAERGLAAVTMSGIADAVGIGRATLYKYFPDIEALLLAWHERQVSRHLEQLTEIRDRAGDPASRLYVVLHAYALIFQTHPSGEQVVMLHRSSHVAHAQQRLHTFVRDLLTEAAHCGDVRDDIPTDELAAYCLHALSAAATLPDHDAVDRLVALTLTCLRTTNQTRSVPVSEPAWTTTGC
jgi:AcrR family transcriptional regulator